MKKTITLSFALCFLIASFTTYYGDAGLQLSDIETEFESGSGAYFGRSNVNEFTFKLERDVNASICHWFHFKLENASGQEVTFRIANYDESLFGYNQRMRPVYSYDNENWSFIEDVWITNAFTFKQGFEQDTVWIVAATPYKYSKLEEYLDSIEDLPYVERESLGSSSDGHRIELHHHRSIHHSRKQADDLDHGGASQWRDVRDVGREGPHRPYPVRSRTPEEVCLEDQSHVEPGWGG